MNKRPTPNLALCALVALLAAPLWAAAAPSPAGIEFFEQQIRPVLAENCYQCHSAHAKKLKGGLMLDSRAAMLKGGDDGLILTPGQPDKSKIIEAIQYTNKDLQMPPKHPLSADQVTAFVKWIKMGAPDPRTGAAAPPPPVFDYAAEKKFWSFQPIKNAQPPKVENAAGLESPIDAFLEADYESHRLRPVGPASKRQLIRRATYDLIGLPPTPGEVSAFLADDSPKAFEKVVDRLLASPHYGEQWGRHWLDVVRYADTSGCNADFPIPQACKYRNYVIDAFNGDEPYDQFLREQIAGDLMPAKDPAQRRRGIIATGYLALSKRFGSNAESFNLTIADTLDNIGKGMLGMTVGCARCHDHKFDPIPTSDYYALYGIFDSTKYAFPGTETLRHPKDFVALGSADDAKKLGDYDTRVTELDHAIRKLSQGRLALQSRLKTSKDVTDQQKADLEQQLKQNIADLKADKAASRKLDEQGPPDVDRAYAVSEGVPHDVRIQRKGSPADLGDKVRRGFLTILGGQKLPASETGSGRLELAGWIADAQNPLTARVMVNRIWEYHFGKGIVATPNDFGHRGAAPVDPALLDYLATRFIKSGWSIKSMQKLIMLSRAYQTSDAEDPADVAIDPTDAYQWRFEPRRLSAEEIRDSVLADAGSLDPAVDPGPHPFPPPSQWHYTQHRPFVDDYPTNHRSVYLMQQRIRKQPFLAVFDGADPNDTSPDRPLSTTAIQALYMMNDPFMYEQSGKLADRLKAADADQKNQINQAYQVLFARPADPGEIATGQEYLAAITAQFRKAGAANPDRAAMPSYLRVLMSTNEFIWLD